MCVDQDVCHYSLVVSNRLAGCLCACAQVLHALTRKFKLSADVDLDQLARSCPVTLSGADLYALCADAWMVAFKRHISSNSNSSSDETTATDGQQQQQQGGASLQLEVCQCDFQQALAALTPSLSQEELARYLAIKQHYDAQQGFAQKPAAAAVQDGPPRQDPFAGGPHTPEGPPTTRADSKQQITTELPPPEQQLQAQQVAVQSQLPVLEQKQQPLQQAQPTLEQQQPHSPQELLTPPPHYQQQQQPQQQQQQPDQVQPLLPDLEQHHQQQQELQSPSEQQQQGGLHGDATSSTSPIAQVNGAVGVHNSSSNGGSDQSAASCPNSTPVGAATSTEQQSSAAAVASGSVPVKAAAAGQASGRSKQGRKARRPGSKGGS